MNWLPQLRVQAGDEERTATRYVTRELYAMKFQTRGHDKKESNQHRVKFKRRFVERRYCALGQRQLEVLPRLIPIVLESKGCQERRGKELQLQLDLLPSSNLQRC